METYTRALVSKGYSTGRLSLDEVAVDSTTLEAKRGELVGYDEYGHVKGSKVHVAVSRESLLLSVVVGPGDEHDSRRPMEVLDGIRVMHGVGRPRSRPREVHADPAYDTKEIGSYLERKGIKANISLNPKNRLKPRRGRPYRVDEEAYKRMRGCVEKFFAWLTGGFRRLALRWERLASTFLGLVQLTCIMIYLRVFR